MPRRRLHGETQKRRQKRRTRTLKLRDSTARVAHTHRPMAYEASPELDGQDLEFLEAMRDLGVRRRPGAGGLPRRREAIAQAQFTSEQQNVQSFETAMQALGVRPLGEGVERAPRAIPRAAGPRTALPPPQAEPDPPPPRAAPRPEPAAPPPPPKRARTGGTRFAEHPDDAALMAQTLREGVADLNEKFQGAPRPTLPRRKARPERDQELAPDAELDLHGATQEQAIQRVQGFLLSSHRARLRRVLIITGRGRNSGEQGPVLREAVTRWLERNGGPTVREFSPAPPRHGGEGALWIELR